MSVTLAIVLIATGAAAGFINVVAGGGSLLTVPVLIFAGLPETTANGTFRVGILVQNVAAVYRYQRAGRVHWRRYGALGLAATLGAIVGALMALRLADPSFRNIFGWLMLAVAMLVALNPQRWLHDANPAAQTPLRHPVWVGVGMWVAGVYGGLVQAGVGYLLLGILTFVGRMPLVDANVAKVAVILCYTVVVLAVFGSTEHVAWGHALLLSAGQAAGAWLGAHAALVRGAPLVRVVLVGIAIAGALALLGVF